MLIVAEMTGILTVGMTGTPTARMTDVALTGKTVGAARKEIRIAG